MTPAVHVPRPSAVYASLPGPGEAAALASFFSRTWRPAAVVGIQQSMYDPTRHCIPKLALYLKLLPWRGEKRADTVPRVARSNYGVYLYKSMGWPDKGSPGTTARYAVFPHGLPNHTITRSTIPSRPGPASMADGSLSRGGGRGHVENEAVMLSRPRAPGTAAGAVCRRVLAACPALPQLPAGMTRGPAAIPRGPRVPAGSILIDAQI